MPTPTPIPIPTPSSPSILNRESREVSLIPTHSNANDLFSIYRETGEFDTKAAFISIKELAFLSYYSTFKLLLCSLCKCAIIGFETHLKQKHLLDLPKKNKAKIIKEALIIYHALNRSTIDESLRLITDFSREFSFFALPELTIHSNLHKCQINHCSIIKASKKTIERHIKEDHKSTFDTSNQISTYYSSITGQALENSRYFFEIKTKDKGVIISNNTSASINEEPLHPLVEESEEIALAKEAFLLEQDQKETSFYSDIHSSKVALNDNLSNFQAKTRYPEFVQSYNPKDLVNLCRSIEDSEEIIKYIIDNLQELLYLTLEKATWLNKIHLNILSSFESGKITNKGFKVLSSSKSRVDYFAFLSNFVVFYLRCFIQKLYKTSKPLFLLSQSLEYETQQLLDLSSSLINNEVSSNLTDIRKSSNYQLNKVNNSRIINLNDSSISSENESNEGSRSRESINLNSNASSTSDSSDSNKSTWVFGEPNAIQVANNARLTLINKIEEANSKRNQDIVFLQTMITSILYELFSEKQDINIFDSCINSFFAIKSMRSDFTFRNTLDLSGYYSKFIYCAQLIVLENAFWLLTREDTSLIDILKASIEQLFKNDSSTALSELLLNRSFCFAVNKTLSGNSNVIVHSLVKDTISYKNVTISVENLRLIYKDLINESYDFLINELLLGISSEEYSTITLEEFSKVENRENTTPYTCFRDYHPNKDANNNWLFNIVLNNTIFRSLFFSFENRKFSINKTKVKQFFNKVLFFKKRTLLMLYLLTGLPMRGTELVSLRHVNSRKDSRELFLDIGSNLFIMNISKFKSQYSSEKAASNIRYLPERVSYIFLLYMTLVEPFINKLLINLSTKKTTTISPYFFFINQRFLQSTDLSSELKSYSLIKIGQPLTIQIYRQVIVAIIREFMEESLDIETITLISDNHSAIKANQMNHSINTEELNYGRKASTFRNIRGDLQSKYLEFCLRYFDFFCINQSAFAINSFLNNLEISNIVINNSKQTASNTLALRYSKSSNESIQDISISQSRKHTRQASSINTSFNNEQVIKKIKIRSLNFLSTATSTSPLLLELLKEFLNNKNADFTIPEQELLIRSILLKVPYILGVLPTSSGKSLAYLFTASLSTANISLIITPLVGLKSDLAKRASTFGIPCCNYEDNQEFKTLTLISIESIIDEVFIQLFISLINKNKIDRIIFDECHLLITAANYRTIMFRFKELLVNPVQVVFLTGTLSFTEEKQLISELKLDQVAKIRANCIRTNISYQAIEFKSKSLDLQIKEIQDYIEENKANFLTLRDKVIIFCPSTALVNHIADALNCCRYSSSLTKSEQELVLKSFTTDFSDFYNIIVCTSGLQEGFDYAYIRLTIYFQHCYEFSGFLQGSSRAGRDKKPAISAFFYNKQNTIPFDNDSKDKSLLKSYLRERICRKRLISLYLNNTLLEECPINTEFCDLCLERTKIYSQQANRIISKCKEVELLRVQLLEYFEKIYINKYCIYCNLIENNDEIRHQSISECDFSEIDQLSMRIKLKFHKTEFNLQDDSCCFKCLFPTVLCYKLRKAQGLDHICLFPKLVFRVIAIFFQVLEVRPKNPDSEYYKSLFSESSLRNIDSFIKSFIQRVYINEIETEAILGFKYLLLKSDA
jgi:superfamily II DNA helicase RecQ